MSLLDELYKDVQSDRQNELEKIHQSDIQQVQNLFKEFKVKRYNIVNVGFGDPLIKDTSGRYHELDKEFSITEMKSKKGLNYGSHEFSYRHDAVILEDIPLRYVNKLTTLLVAPISSTKRRNSILLEKKFYPFLQNDSYILLNSITNIGIEKIYITNTKRRLSRQGQEALYELTSPVQIELKKVLSKIFSIS